jgi:hypothetical protein
MFTVRLGPGVYLDGVSISAEAPTLEQALGFVGEFCSLKHAMLEILWQERDGRYVIDVYDWCDCWFADPPVLAQIIAPRDFTPPGAGGIAV